MNSRWSLNRQNLFYQIFLAWKLKKFFNQNIVFNWQLPDLQNVFICFSKVNLSSLVTARSSTESLGILLIDEGAELFCKFLFVIIIFWNFLGLWFDISQSIVVLNAWLRSSISDATSVEDANNVLSYA